MISRKIMRGILAITLGLIAYFILLTAITGLFEIAFGGKQKSLDLIISLSAFSFSSMLAGYVVQEKGSLIGLLLSVSVIALILIGWGYLLNLPHEKIFDILGSQRGIVFEFMGYIAAGLLFGHVGGFIQKYFATKKQKQHDI